MSSSKSRSKHQEEDLKAKRKAYLSKADPSTVEQLVDSDDLGREQFKEGQWRPSWANVEFDEDACLQNVMFVPPDGYYVPAGSMLPLGAQMPEMTVLQYGGYFPEGTSFPGGVLVPMHARMVNILPEQTIKPSGPVASESICSIQ
ncbi:hypothetical protein I204_08368 [Kwoniella mangroviensis CBS 8886]|uniref:uncharacterized protein n=1 Tax=Kwoniella mangroviensis CBS 8507 TaxID=1296122 RepID=UPI00080CEDE6|nr:uncharacterized protein I203_01475 [Kwoniella mangroviensis CBS 8507]OCF69611.1 hypothetical protein I203_01475 [Kwoniella mangroviensis CBS 8507]OCF70933.1 hypothetical protein I204_08368 [Kwoniella mangroviensis CBS 8886]